MAAKVTPPISPLRRALAESRLREVDVAEALGVDPKTVQRWLAGRLPQPRHRWGLADLIQRHEYDLWPQLANGLAPTINREIRATYTHRGAVPRELWRQLFCSGQNEIGILVYAGLFLAEDIDLIRIMRHKAEDGVTIRILLGDPDSEQVALRGAEEGIAEAMAAKIRNVIVLYRLLLDVPTVAIRLHTTVLYNSIYRANDEMLVNPQDLCQSGRAVDLSVSGNRPARPGHRRPRRGETGSSSLPRIRECSMSLLPSACHITSRYDKP
jgi:hypothetical protein